MKKLLLLLFVCCTAFSCEQNDVIDTKVKIEKVIPDGAYIRTMRWTWDNNEDDLYRCIGDEYPNMTTYILIENNTPYRYYEKKCSNCNTRLIEKSNSNITVDLKDKLWEDPDSEYDIIKYTKENITLFETKQHARERHKNPEDHWCRDYIVFERVDDNGELFQKLKAAKSYTLEEYRKWWKENGCERCLY